MSSSKIRKKKKNVQHAEHGRKPTQGFTKSLSCDAYVISGGKGVSHNKRVKQDGKLCMLASYHTYFLKISLRGGRGLLYLNKDQLY